MFLKKSPSRRIIGGFLLTVMLVSLTTYLSPLVSADATDRTYGFYDQTYEINGSSRSYSRGIQGSSSSGAFTYALPLALPPGRSGFTPGLSLSYNSQSRDLDSFFGYGWSMDFPSITRLSKTGIEKFYTDNYFTSSLSGELVATTGTEYAAKVEEGDFLTYDYDSSGFWTATDKSGKVYTFGSSTAAQQADPSDATHIYKWLLEEIRDTNDNFIHYEYTTDNGQLYPSQITYTGSGSTEGPFAVDFTLEARSDTTNSYQSGFEVETNYRVASIGISFNTTLLREYDLAYITPDNSERSLLESVRESAWDDSGTETTLPATTFTYADSDKGWTETSSYNIPVYFYISGSHTDKGVDFADVDGDGLIDILDSGYYSSTDSATEVYLNQGDGTGWIQDTAYSIPTYFWSYSGNTMRNTRLADVDGDGFSDIFFGSSSDSPYTQISRADPAAKTWAVDSSYTMPLTFNSGYANDQGVRLLDINGDGFPDFVQSLYGSTIYQKAYLFDPETQTWVEDRGISIPVYFDDQNGYNEEGVELADVNGDGLVDLIQSVYNSGSYQGVYLNQGDGSGWVLDSNYSIPIYFWASNSIMMDQVQIVDVDGDGLGDLVQSYAGSGSYDDVYINQGDGTGWALDSAYSVPVYFTTGYGDYQGVQFFDADGDGFPDLIQSRSDSSTSTKKVYLNNATPELLTGIESSKGSSTAVEYVLSTESSNPTLPFNMTLVLSVTTDDGLGVATTTTYDYADGAYFYEDELNRQFAGFGTVTKTENGRETVSYYHQDSLAKIGHPYQTDVYDASGNLYQRTLDVWGTTDLGYDNTYVYETKKIGMTYDGGTTHRDTATAYTYDAYGNVKTVINYGEVTASTDGSFTDVTDVDEKNTTTYTYATDSGGVILNKVADETIKNGSNVNVMRNRYYYDGAGYGTVSVGNVTRAYNWYDVTNAWYYTTYTYNSYGLVATMTNPRGYRTSYSYDSYNLYPATITNPKSYTTSNTYDYRTGQVTSHVDENSITSSTSYDGFGRPLTVTLPDPTTGTATTATTYSYDDTSVPTSVTISSTVNSVSTENVTYYDGYGRTVQTNTLAEDAIYNTVDTWYDELGNVEEQTLPYETSSSAYGRDDTQYSVTSTFDTLNRPLTVTSPTGTTSYDYSLWENTVTDPNGVDKNYGYDAAGHLLTVEEENGTDTYTTTYEYDPLGQLITLTDAQGNERNFDYDSLGRKISEQDLHDPTASSFGTWTYTYDKNNNLSTQTDPKGQVITWAYDQLDRVTYEDWDTSTTARDQSYLYDTATRGRMKLYRVNSNSTDKAVIYSTYDYLGNPTKETDYFKKPGLTTYYTYIYLTTYDLLSRPTKIIYPSSALTINYTYNATGDLEKVTRGTSTLTNVVSDIDYNSAGQIEEETYGNGVVTSNIYDPAQGYRLTYKTTTGIFGGAAGAVQNLTYSYDANGNITYETDASMLPTYKTLTYAYDDLNRLTTAASSESGTGIDYSQSYSYDEVGNMTSKSDVGILTYAGTGYPNPHAVTDVAGTAYTYDNNGNLTSDGIHSYTWDKRNRLITSGTKSYSYDASGSRYKIIDTSSATPYTYYVNRLEELRNGTTTSAGTPTYYIFAGGQRVASLESSVYTYYSQDHLGGTAVATDSTGEVSEYYDYYPYGSELTSTQLAATTAKHTFTDKEYDDSAGLFYFEARWYNPAIGRFVSEDPMQFLGGIGKIIADPQSLNFYAYSRNNPVNFTDPSGEFAFIPFLLAAAGVALTAWDVYDVADTTVQSGPVAGTATAVLSFVNPIPNKVTKFISEVPAVKNLITSAATKIDNLLGMTSKGADNIHFTYGTKIQDQITKRGWDGSSVQETLNNPFKTIDTKDVRHLSDGSRMDDPATAFMNEDGSYVVRNNNSGDIVQVSNKNDPDWKSPFNE